MSAEGLLRAVNALRARALAGARPYELKYAGPGAEPLPRDAATLAPAAEPTLLDPTPLVVSSSGARIGGGTGGYWTPGKALFWGAVLGTAALFYWWDVALAERWEAMQLKRRIRQRREGKRRFSAAETFDDILELLLLKGAADAAEEAKRRAEASSLQLGWQRTSSSSGGGGKAEGQQRDGGGEVIDVVADDNSDGDGTSGSSSQQQQQQQKEEKG
jgi:hypothetical protein